MDDRGKPTLHDVGALAGVAARTVSRVINNEAGVSRDTAAKVCEAIAQLGFRPNLAARALKSDRSLQIAILNNNPSLHYVADVVRGVSRACKGSGYYLTLEEFAPDDCNVAQAVGELLRSVRIAGALLVPPLTDDDPVLMQLEDHDIPFVRLTPAGNIGRSHAVIVRDAEGIEALVDHLVSIGHRTFGIVAGPASHGSAKVRHAAFVGALARHGIEGRQAVFKSGDYTYRSGMDATAAILAVARPTVICAFNDEMAAGVISALGQRNIVVPRDVAVAGFDDSEIARMIWPPLTTIRQSIMEQAAAATRLLIDPKTSPEPQLIEQSVSLIIRKSTSRE
ncbi:LacI family DNA-binding transcriptional regulator [Sphingobium sp. BYY-5]|uniref:LacI family DNA-binding transcriptional regulator n=1 Tax=Sphingobium sp. BYY-5 TaxID=2926400 RepID=UPI001FA79A3D|nr:LacI family DNA-binding transcriptional regulator [Sphingobium sp. BYY-5]MCI4589555.1 LacI family DNA-binding transcriptional regulator [Sphingobium sp. BYY-5]